MQRLRLQALKSLERTICNRPADMLPEELRDLQTRRNELGAHVGRLHTLALTNASSCPSLTP